MAVNDRTRADLRTALQYHSDSKLTLAADQDYYLNLAELKVFTDWRKFDPGLFRPVRDSVATDTNGVLLLDANFSRLEYLEDGNGVEYKQLMEMNLIRRGTGYYFIGFDQTNNQRQAKIIKNGTAVASTTFYWYNIVSMLMGTATTAKSAIPNEHRSLITFYAAFLLYRDKGTAFVQSKEDWKHDYKEALAEAESWYRNVGRGVQYAPSMDPDAGAGAQFASVIQS